MITGYCLGLYRFRDLNIRCKAIEKDGGMINFGPKKKKKENGVNAIDKVERCTTFRREGLMSFST